MRSFEQDLLKARLDRAVKIMVSTPVVIDRPLTGGLIPPGRLCPTCPDRSWCKGSPYGCERQARGHATHVHSGERRMARP